MPQHRFSAGPPHEVPVPWLHRRRCRGQLMDPWIARVHGQTAHRVSQNRSHYAYRPTCAWWNASWWFIAKRRLGTVAWRAFGGGSPAGRITCSYRQPALGRPVFYRRSTPLHCGPRPDCCTHSRVRQHCAGCTVQYTALMCASTCCGSRIFTAGRRLSGAATHAVWTIYYIHHACYTNAMVGTAIRPRFDGRSTAYQRSKVTVT